MNKTSIIFFIIVAMIFPLGIGGCGENSDYDDEMQLDIVISDNLANEQIFGEDLFYLSGEQYFPYFEGNWVAVEYVGDANDSQPVESYTEEYWADQEERKNEIIEEYLGSEYCIETDNMKYFCPITELGYIMENDDDLFFCTRFAHLDFSMTPPYIGACVYLLDTNDSYYLILDDNGTLIIEIMNSYFRLEKKVY